MGPERAGGFCPGEAGEFHEHAHDSLQACIHMTCLGGQAPPMGEQALLPKRTLLESHDSAKSPGGVHQGATESLPRVYRESAESLPRVCREAAERLPPGCRPAALPPPHTVKTAEDTDRTKSTKLGLDRACADFHRSLPATGPPLSLLLRQTPHRAEALPCWSELTTLRYLTAK